MPPAFNELLTGLFRATTSLARRTAEVHGLTLHQAIAIDVIGRDTAQPMAELCQELELTMSGVSKLVDKLVGQGLVARGPHPGDRRAIRLALTEAGLARKAAIQADWDKHMQAWLAEVPGRPAIEASLEALLAAAPRPDP